MSSIKKLYKYITDEKYRLAVNMSKGVYNKMPDEEYLKFVFKARMGKELDLAHPESFSEKLQWLKLYDHDPRYTRMVDKYEVKRYAADLIGEQYIIPTLGVWDRFEDIDFALLPDRFVLKCTHDSGGNVFCTDKSRLNMDQAREKIRKSLKRNYYYLGREWPYKNVRPRIIAEEYMEDDPARPDAVGLSDYKIHCFSGVPKFILVCRDRFSTGGLTEDFFDTQWDHLDVRREKHGNAAQEIERPKELEKMLELAERLSSGIPFLRCDFYTVQNKIYIGELTLFPANGFEKFLPESFDYKIGKWLVLPELK